MKLFKCIIDDGQQVFKVFKAAKSKKALLDIYGGNGQFEKIEDVSENYPIHVVYLEKILREQRYGEAEISLITESVRACCNALED